jgi:hypothetical protein
MVHPASYQPHGVYSSAVSLNFDFFIEVASETSRPIRLPA